MRKILELKYELSLSYDTLAENYLMDYIYKLVTVTILMPTKIWEDENY